MAVLLKTASVHVSFIQIMQVRVQNKGKSVWNSRYVRDVSEDTSCLPNIELSTERKNTPDAPEPRPETLEIV